jgi:hypothetical protein
MMTSPLPCSSPFLRASVFFSFADADVAAAAAAAALLHQTRCYEFLVGLVEGYASAYRCQTFSRNKALSSRRKVN